MTLFGTVFSWVIWRRCVLVDLEYYFRARYGVVRPAQSSFISHIGYKILGDRAPRESIIVIFGGVFLGVSLLCWLLQVSIYM